MQVAYIVVEQPSLQEAGVHFTRRHPEATLDQFVWRTEGQARQHITMLVRGVRGPPIDALAKELKDATGGLVEHRRDDTRGRWLVSYEVPRSYLQDPTSAALAAFTDRHGLEARWVRIEDGRAFTRYEFPEDAEPEDLASRLRGFLEGRGIDADVGVERARVQDPGPWEELIEELVEMPVRLPDAFNAYSDPLGQALDPDEQAEA